MNQSDHEEDTNHRIEASAKGGGRLACAYLPHPRVFLLLAFEVRKSARQLNIRVLQGLSVDAVHAPFFAALSPPPSPLLPNPESRLCTRTPDQIRFSGRQGISVRSLPTSFANRSSWSLPLWPLPSRAANPRLLSRLPAVELTNPCLWEAWPGIPQP